MQDEGELARLVSQPLTPDERRVLLASEFGRGLSPKDLAVMMTAGYARLADWSRGSIITLAGSTQSEFLVVLTGRLDVARTRPDGSRQIVDVVGAGGACGAVTAFGSSPRWPADVHAVSDVRALAVRAAALVAGGGADETRLRLLHNCTRILAERARHMSGRVELLTRRGLRERLAYYLLRNAGPDGVVVLGLTRQELADVLVVSRASMTRELGRMADEGLIGVRGRSFVIYEPDALHAASG